MKWQNLELDPTQQAWTAWMVTVGYKWESASCLSQTSDSPQFVHCAVTAPALQTQTMNIGRLSMIS
jgi:hypothetical protein